MKSLPRLMFIQTYLLSFHPVIECPTQLSGHRGHHCISLLLLGKVSSHPKREFPLPKWSPIFHPQPRKTLFCCPKHLKYISQFRILRIDTLMNCGTVVAIKVPNSRQSLPIYLLIIHALMVGMYMYVVIFRRNSCTVCYLRHK